MSIKAGVISLGCDKNRVDTERLLQSLAEANVEITGGIGDADVIFINTCAFTEAAKAEAIDAILEALEEKERRGAKVVVTGCLPERYREKLSAEFDKVDAFSGIHAYGGVNEILSDIFKSESQNTDESRCYFPAASKEPEARILTTPPHYAYLKIADGCDNRCTYCAIPKIRGSFRSRPIEKIVKESQALIDNYGVKELILVAQDTSRYGSDLYGKPSLIELLRKLCMLEIEWIRVLYLYPELITDELIELMAGKEKIVKYADIPLQHISDGVLKRMARRGSKAEIISLLEKLKVKNFTLRSSFIAGFPGETEEEFSELISFIEAGYIDYAGFFAYSKEDGTAAARMKGQIPKRIRESRANLLRAAQSRVMAEKCKGQKGKVLRVLYEDIDYDKGLFFGRAAFQAPDIDNLVLFSADFAPEVGEFYEVEITGSSGIDLVGRAVKPSA
jgi:ribosomal protein S12 methylthiotransferase